MPPCVTKRISDFAFGGSMGAFGASRRCGSAPAEALNDGKSAPAARLVSMNRRRVREVPFVGFIRSIHVDQFTRIPEGMTKIRDGRGTVAIPYRRLIAQKIQCRSPFGFRRQPGESQLKGAVN